jgi:undecaprenyl-phosphate 4-deoxy-4-formamido-L-arabinose transferase
VFNEGPNLHILYSRVTKVLDDYGRTYEIIAVDDGSRDDSFKILEELHRRDPRLRIVRLARNFGQTPALYAGFTQVRGQVVVTIDADLQNPPEEMIKVIEKLEEGYDAVQGWRENRQDPLFRRIASKALNRVVSYLIGTRIRDLGCGLKAYRRDTIERLNKFTHRSRYLPAEVVWLGVRLAEVQVAHQPREKGVSKYGIFDLLKLNFNIISSISTVPIKVIGGFGWLFALVGFLISARILYVRLIMGNLDPLLTVTAIIFVLVGVQLIALGIMCEYIGRIFIEVQSKPYFVIRDVTE